MTQSYVAPYVHHVTDGITSIFAYTFYIAASSEIEAYVNGVFVSNYTVSGVGVVGGGNLTFLAPPAAGTLFIRRVTPRTQNTDYVANDAFSAASHENAIDKLTRLVQDLIEELSRRPALATHVLSALRNLTIPSPGALQIIGWNAAGTALTLFDSAILQVTPDSVSGLAFAKSSQELTPSGGESSLTASSLFPAGSLGIGATYRCTTAFGATGGLTSVDLGDGIQQDRWGSTLGITLATVSNVGQFTEAGLWVNNSALDVILTANGGTFDAVGAAIVTAHYLTLTPDTSV